MKLPAIGTRLVALNAARVRTALGPASLTAVVQRRGRPTSSVSIAVEPREETAATWLGLRLALSELRASLGLATPRLSVALVPPLVEFKPLSLASGTAEELERALERQAERWFTGFTVDAAVGVGFRRTRTRRDPLARVVACNSKVLQAVFDEASAAGFRLDSVCSAQSAALAELRSMAGTGAGETAAVLEFPETIEVLRLQRGAFAWYRRVPQTAIGWAAFRGVLTGPPRIEVLPADAEDAAEVSRATFAPSTLVFAGEHRQRIDDEIAAAGLPTTAAGHSMTAEELVARGARRAQPRLLTVAEREKRVADLKRRVGALVAVCVALLGFALLASRVDAASDRAAIRAERARIAAEVSRGLQLRNARELTSSLAEELSDQLARYPAWSERIVDLASTLPSGASATLLQGHGDSLVIEGVTDDVHATLASLAAPALVADARLLHSASPESNTPGAFRIALRYATSDSVR